MSSNAALVELVRRNSVSYLDAMHRDDRVLQAMLEVDRAEFLPANVRNHAYRDEPVSIGFAETCSEPSMVAFILDKLEIRDGNKVLEIGSGCGYAAAMASRLCGSSGKIYACEVIPHLAYQMKLNFLKKYADISIIITDGSAGFPELAPFDRIFLSAGVDSERFNSKVLVEQLSEAGKLIYPEAYGSLHVLEKQGSTVTQTTYPGVRFVPLTGKNS